VTLPYAAFAFVLAAPGASGVPATTRVWVHAYRVDVADVAQMRGAHAHATALLQQQQQEESPAAAMASDGPAGIEAVICNAGIVAGKDLDALTPRDVSRSFAVNTFPAYALLHLCLPAMRRSRTGSVVLVSSIMGRLGGAQLADYCGSKAALFSLAECTRLELARDGIGGNEVSVSLIAPYHVRTQMFETAFRDKNWLRNTLFPPLEESAVANVLVEAALDARRHQIVMLPWLVAVVIHVCAYLLPMWLHDWTVGYMGGWHGMQSYRPPPAAATTTGAAATTASDTKTLPVENIGTGTDDESNRVRPRGRLRSQSQSRRRPKQ
jgi:NAD(P)-dependent dehydrogenase (short-subunit alcohol dehydrogenase family)